MPRSVLRSAVPWLATLATGAGLCTVLCRDARTVARAARSGAPVHQAPRPAVRSSAPAPFRGIPAVGEGSIDVRENFDGRRDDPAYAAPWLRQQHEIIERQYGYAIDSLQLPLATAERLKDLLTARREAVVDARDTAKAAGIEGPDVNLAVERSVDALTQDIKDLIGSDAYYNSIEIAPAVSGCRDMLGSAVGSELEAMGDPLSNDQLYALAEAYVATNYAPGTQEPGGVDPSTGLTPQFQAFLDRAAGTVDQSQAASIRDYLVSEAKGASALN